MKLAIRGGSPVRTTPFPAWPIYDQRESKGAAVGTGEPQLGRLSLPERPGA
jgi:hypothetical protein